MACMLFTVSNMLSSVEYLHSMSCRHRLSLYVLSSTKCPRGFRLYPMALMIYGLRCCCRLRFGSRLVRINVGCCVNVLSFCIPSSVHYRACRV